MCAVATADPVCPLCGSHRFAEHGGRPAARCEQCGALERHRALARQFAPLLEHGRGRRALEVGPLSPHVFGRYLRDRGWDYTSVDSSRQGNPADPRRAEFVDFEVDVRALTGVKDRSVSLVLVQHVLEEIEDYEAALREIRRVLAPRGDVLLEIPFDPRRERSERHPPDRFGNVWAFGRDLLPRIGVHLGQVEVHEYLEGAGQGTILRCREARANPVAVENALPGDGDWWGRHAPARTIEGYASDASVRPGERLELHVSTTPAQRYRITVHRLGWYGGRGGRTMVRHPGSSSDLQGLPRPAPSVGGDREVRSAGWPVTDALSVGEDWPSGVYVARLVLTTGEHAGSSSFVPFVVRPAYGAVADILVQQGITTAQAYNNVGGKSLYTSNSSDAEAAVRVTFERPFQAWEQANLNARWPFVWDVQLLRFLEREGFDVAYTTDIDTHREPWSLTGHRLLMTSGHDEYWTREMRDAFEQALADGTNLACMGANTGYWQIRLEAGERTMIEYRTGDPEPDQATKTTRFRDLNPPRPECRLFGIQYQDGMTRAGLPPRDFELTSSCLGHPWLEGSGFEHPASLAGLVGYEWDALQPGMQPPDATVFFHYHCPDISHADTVAHTASSGARVFAAGSLQFAWGLDDWGHDGYADERLQRFMRNVLEDLVGAGSGSLG